MLSEYSSIGIFIRISELLFLSAMIYLLPVSDMFPETRLVSALSLSESGSLEYKNPWSAVMMIFEPLMEFTTIRTRFFISSTESVQASNTCFSVFALSPTASILLWYIYTTSAPLTSSLRCVWFIESRFSYVMAQFLGEQRFSILSRFSVLSVGRPSQSIFISSLTVSSSCGKSAAMPNFVTLGNTDCIAVSFAVPFVSRRSFSLSSIATS